LPNAAPRSRPDQDRKTTIKGTTAGQPAPPNAASRSRQTRPTTQPLVPVSSAVTAARATTA
jgi:hypothetical protein